MNVILQPLANRIPGADRVKATTVTVPDNSTDEDVFAHLYPRAAELGHTANSKNVYCDWQAH